MTDDLELYHQLFQHAPIGIIRTTLGGRLLDVNPALAQMLGYRSVEENITAIKNIVSELYVDPLHREKLLRITAEKDRLLNFESQFYRKDGSIMDCRIHVRIARGQDGGVSYLEGFVEDISQQKRTSKALEDSEIRYRSVFENTGSATIIIEADMTISLANTGFVKMTGYSKKEIEGKMKWPAIIARTEDLERMMAYHFNRRKFEENVPIEYEFILMDRQGVKKNVFARVDMIAGTQRSVASILDVSFLKKKGALLQKENLRLRSALKDSCRLGNIIGKSLSMQQVYEMILRASATDANVIIYGKSGTGKELVARAIHDMSDRRDRRLVPVNCGAIPRELMESEFFGYRKGGFTGAVHDKPGFFDLAAGGTLFLDELGELTEQIQVKLLRVLEGGGYTPIGGVEPCQPDVRIVAATNHNLSDLVRSGRMREDFFYRIHIIPIYMPPLCERKDDIPLLVDYFLHKYDPSRSIVLSKGELDMLKAHDWPGNVRELENTLQRYVSLNALAFAGDSYGAVKASTKKLVHDLNAPTLHLREAVRRFEKSYITESLRRHGWNRTKTASALGLGRKTLYLKMKQLGITPQPDAVLEITRSGHF